MEKLIDTIETIISGNKELPFSVYSSIKEQKLLNVPIVKPLLIVVLEGEKYLGKDGDIVCHAGDFIFLSDSPAIDMRNIPKEKSYFALLIDFSPQDFSGLNSSNVSGKYYSIGKTTLMLEKCLQQFVESIWWAPKELWSSRKREILELLCHIGHKDILSMLGGHKVGYKLHELFCANNFEAMAINDICHHLAMSESTLRRRLKSEGTSIQEVKDRARLGQGLHLLQTSNYSVGLIADMCGYQSQSKFSARFKARFGLTPSELKKTKMTD